MQTSLNTKKVRILSEASIFIALTIVLKDVLPPLFQMPQGGSVSLAGLVPLLWFALRRGVKYGVFAGLIYGLIHAFLPGSYIIDPLQGLLDYPLAFAALGVLVLPLIVAAIPVLLLLIPLFAILLLPLFLILKLVF